MLRRFSVIFQKGEREREREGGERVTFKRVASWSLIPMHFDDVQTKYGVDLSGFEQVVQKCEVVFVLRPCQPFVPGKMIERTP